MDIGAQRALLITVLVCVEFSNVSFDLACFEEAALATSRRDKKSTNGVGEVRDVPYVVERRCVDDDDAGTSDASTEVLSEDSRKSVLNRLSRIIGHLQSIRRMAETGREIEPMLVQISAVKAAVNGVGKEMVGELLQARSRRDSSDLSSDDVDEILTLVCRYLK